MARNLPWKTGESSTRTKTVRKTKAPTPSRVKPKPKALPDDEETITSKASKLRVPKQNVRPRSSSPGEETEVEYMEEGFDGDDKWAMVEDELFATAKTFTRHFHQAALEEMEKAAKTKSKETVAAISRPTSIAMPSNTKRSLAGKARAKKQGEGVQKLLAQGPGGKDDDDDDPDAVPSWIGTSLHGLMEAPKKPPPSLAQLGVMKARRTASQTSKTTKPSSYSSQFTSQTKSFEVSNTTKQVSFLEKDDDATASEEEDDDDDLDAKPKAPKVAALPPSQSSKPEPKALPRTSIFLQAKQKLALAPKSEERSSIGIPQKTNSVSHPSIFNRSIKVEEVTESNPNPPSAQPPAPDSKPIENVPSLAEIKRRLAERRRRVS